MRTLGNCSEMLLLVQAEIDGELDAAQAVAVRSHRATCADCAAAYAHIRMTRRMVRGAGAYRPAPVEFRENLEAQLRQAAQGTISARPRRVASFWRPALPFGAGMAIAASLALFLLPQAAPDLGDAIVAGHIRALQPGHLTDVASTDQHNVKPWFDGRLDFSPPVKNLDDQGFLLTGGRLDYIGDRPVAAIVYKRRQHLIDVFVWPLTGQSAGQADSAPVLTVRNGYNTWRWVSNDMAIAAVSDLNQAELRDFVDHWLAMP